MKISCSQLNDGPCKTYLIENDLDNSVIVIDPVIDRIEQYVRLIKDKNFSLTLIIDTHTHADHISGGASLKDIFKCDYAMHANSPVKCAGFRFFDSFHWKLFDTIDITALHTPGHTRDSVSLVFPDWVFTGDALFLDDGGAGRDDLPGGDPNQHYDSLRKLYDLPDHLIVYPAHDYRNRQPSSLGHQKETNPHLRKSRESREVFVQFLEDLKLGAADWMKDVLKANYACARDPNAAWIPVDSPACEVKGTMVQSANEMEIASIPPTILRQKLAESNKPVLLDVREVMELDGPLGHLEGIVHIPIGSLLARLKELEKYHDQEIITVCRSGGRAYTAAQILMTAGFEQVLVLEGGMIGWNAMRSPSLTVTYDLL
jgi:sulfur dioxygenase